VKGSLSWWIGAVVVGIGVGLPGHAQQAAAQPAPTQPAAQDQKFSRAEVTGVLASSRKIVSPNGIEELIPVQIGGIPQWISIRGKDKQNPVLLVLHGGPGSAIMPEDYTFQTPWEDYFTVVEWDQRGAGKTYAANDPAKLADTMTIAQMTRDAEDVVQYLRARFAKKKIFLLGHSWGSVLGVRVAQEHPEWLYAYIGVGQMVNTQKSEALGYKFALDSAIADRNAKAEQELRAIAPYPEPNGEITIEKLSADRKWLMYYGGLTFGRKDYDYDADAQEFSPDYSQKDVDSIDAGGLYSLKNLIPPLEPYDIDQTTRFRCPVILFNGRHDYTVSQELAAAWFARVHAPRKKMVWFEDSAHMMMQEQPGRFLYHLLTDARPLAAKAGAVAPDEVVEK
jgi:pimeloyl-ACP methyl ester carboxylesterase